MLQSEAVEYLCVSQPTFIKQSKRLGVSGEHIGRCTYYNSEDIRWMKEVLDKKVDILIAQLERKTGKRVQLT